MCKFRTFGILSQFLYMLSGTRIQHFLKLKYAESYEIPVEYLTCSTPPFIDVYKKENEETSLRSSKS